MRCGHGALIKKLTHACLPQTLNKMKTKLITEIEMLESCTELLRKTIGVSKRGEILFHAPISMWSERDIAVEADGEGGALLLVVEGNYPDDYATHSERRFQYEGDACEAAQRMMKEPLAKGA